MAISDPVFAWLMKRARTPQDLDVQALGRIVLHRCSGAGAAWRTALGLEPDELSSVVGRFFPTLRKEWEPGACFGASVRWRAGAARPGCCSRTLFLDHARGPFSMGLLEREEADLRRLFLGHAERQDVLATLFARVIARACMEPEHLWVALGLTDRAELSAILIRHFRALYDRNSGNMRWKRFFYRVLCDEEKIWACSSPSCALCAHHSDCYVD